MFPRSLSVCGCWALSVSGTTCSIEGRHHGPATDSDFPSVFATLLFCLAFVFTFLQACLTNIQSRDVLRNPEYGLLPCGWPKLGLSSPCTRSQVKPSDLFGLFIRADLWFQH
ncbi:hypothetical protein SISNIDRAFT_211528 [Sistotremastrum niveocremeum HHB9708]|uniref:Uncharacterized protein n=1 Tax=Sistotremastrum niveocremeum HHB9708 TaxID=1314777 RepID=A0A164R2I5_9AGAM|nr:hypothetical protein SISNIDRAFT_211528 [Sistotremastrum niveocremeum HHB9708]